MRNWHYDPVVWREFLKELGVKRGDRVGIFMNKSLESVISLYGIMKAGAAYVPLDPFAPSARLSYVIKAAESVVCFLKMTRIPVLQHILAANTELEHILGVSEIGELSARSISWDTIFKSPPLSNPYQRLTEQDLSYILYTSGSTGNPKGIVHTHRSLVKFCSLGTRYLFC